MSILFSTLDALNERELEILQLLDDGLTDREIAHKLTLALATVKWYNRQIYGKLGVSSRAQAVAHARRLHLLNHIPDISDIAGSDKTQSQAASTGDYSVHHLPAQTTALIGREHEIAEIQHLLLTSRLLTLTGSPGTGKTRLAFQVAAIVAPQFRDGVYCIPLAPLTDTARLINAIAEAFSIEEVISEPLIQTLKQHLSLKHVLLILDNFEHLLEGASLVSELLANVPQLKILVTSRAPLNLYGEVEYFVPPLALPAVTDNNTVAEITCEAVTLFVQRAQALKSGFELTEDNALDVAKICIRLDGLPLAIELAAARSKLLTPKILLERLSNRLETLVGGARDLPSRQQTLRNTLDWSYDLLNESEKQLFARLSVFRGGWSLEAAEYVCSRDLSYSVLNGLTTLIDKSLVQQNETSYGEPRFMILESIREYALERLEESGEAETMRIAHADYFTRFVERTGKTINNLYRSDGISRMEAEQPNIRAILGWSLAGDPVPGLRLIAEVAICWRIRSYMVEGFQWAQQLLAKGTDVVPELRAHALSSTATLLACHLGNLAEADHMSQEALALALSSGDPRTLARAYFARASALIELDPAAAHDVVDTALALYRELDERWELARTINLKGELLRLEGQYDAAKTLYEEALILFRELGNPWGINVVLNNLAAVAQYHQDIEQSRILLVDALAVSMELKDRCSIAAGLDGLAGVLGLLHQPRHAAQLCGAADSLRTMIGAYVHAGDRGDYERNLDIIRTQLNEDTFEAAWEEGQKMPLAQALEIALQNR